MYYSICRSSCDLKLGTLSKKNRREKICFAATGIGNRGLLVCKYMFSRVDSAFRI
jgi:chemotaxis response regulator CheB